MKKNTRWWRKEKITVNSSLCLSNNAMVLAVEHKAKEWCIHIKRESAAMSSASNNGSETTDVTASSFNRFIGHFSPVNCGEVSRHVVGVETDTLEIKPSLADRPIVCRPISPITILPGASVVIYVSTPIWLTVGLQSKKNIILKDIATQRLSDTWFGTSTREGELCYASQTNGRLDIEKLPQRSERAITPLLIENKADNDLHFERIAIPTPALSLYECANGQLWTQNVTLIREDDGDFATLKLGQQPKSSTLINGPRNELAQGKLVRAFSAIFN